MTNKIEMHGWKDLIIPTEAVITLSSRSLKLFCYLIFRARDKDSAYPGQQRIANELSVSRESWSIATVKRAFAELVEYDWIVRNRRTGTSSVTHIFKSPIICREYKASQLTDEPTVSSQMSRQLAHGRSEKENTEKENTEKNTSSVTEKKQKKHRPRDPFFDNVCTVCGLDPYHLPPGTKGSSVGKVVRDLKSANWTADDIAAYHRWRLAKGLGVLGSIYWLVTEMAKTEWRSNGSSTVNPDINSGDTRARDDLRRIMQERRNQ